MRFLPLSISMLLVFLASSHIQAQFERDSSERFFQPINVFDLEYASDPQISPNGEQVAYVRNFMDILKDQLQSNLWIVESDGSKHRAMTSGNYRDFFPRWSPDGSKLLFLSNRQNGVQMHLRWMDSGESAKLTNLTQSPSSLSWSPDGKWIAFTMPVVSSPSSLVQMPNKPEGAEWAEPAK